VAVAWKDVREARRAVQDALPFLREAENVVIVEVSEHSKDFMTRSYAVIERPPACPDRSASLLIP
jgi:hypothetical protein